jgi:diguanylate cyclase
VPRRDRGQVLRWLATAVVVGGLLAVTAVLFGLDEDLAATPAWLLPALTGLVAVASASVVRVRQRSAMAGWSWTDAATLICIVWLPSAWVPLCVGTGVLVAKLLRRVTPFKAVYNAAKDSLAATAGLLVAVPLGLAESADPLAHPWQLVLVALAVTVTENVVGVPVLALASATPWHRVLRTDGALKVFSFVGKLAVALLTLRLLDVDGRLLAVIPPVALCLHLTYAGRVRARTERAAWRRLAASTEDLYGTDLTTVAGTAVVNAATLFAADEAEVFLRDGPDGPILVRGDADGVRWSGDPGRAPPRRTDGEGITARLAGRAVEAPPPRSFLARTSAGRDPDARPEPDLGELRLHYAGQVDLTDRERLALRTFVSALHTALRNATASAEARRLELRNDHAARHDPLTGLANRPRLEEYGQGLLAEPGATALVVVDLDLFRDVNETLGHLAGDRLLADVARRLAGRVGSDDLVARLGGDAFAVLLARLPSAGAAEQRARDLLEALDEPVVLGGLRVRVDASAGVAVAEDALPPALGGPTGDDPTGAQPVGGMVELLRRADVALHHAKRGGPSVVRYHDRLDTADAARLALAGDLPRAIAEREFAVSFQPIVDLTTGEMIAAEALARWHHPDRGDLGPRRFLSAVERSGLLPGFAEAVLDQALAAMLRWRAAGVDAPVAVNASPRSLLDAAFPRMVVDRLRANGAGGGDLVLELTETLTLAQVDQIGGVLDELRAAGVRLALDDFGTGFSSLGMLDRVRVDELKIDRSFVASMDSSPQAAAAVRLTIELGRSLDMLVVAEGVESARQRRALWAQGCPAGQGHLFGRPMSIEALLDALRGADGSPVRLAESIHASKQNVIELPRVRRGESVG